MNRLRSLDGLRGIAAAIVVLHHAALVLPAVRPAIMQVAALRLFVAGPQAVALFFVISGFVLYESWAAGDGMRWRDWAVWRTLRLMIPLIASTVLAELLVQIIRPQPVPGLSDWFNLGSWRLPTDGWPGVRALLLNLLPLDGSAAHQLNNVVWSLVHELRLSIAFPLIAWGVARRPWLTAGLALELLVISPIRARGLLDPVSSLHFVWLFVAGALLARNRAMLGRAPAPLSITLLLLGLAVVTADALAGPVAGLGAIAIVAAAVVPGPIVRALSIRPLLWLGERSFSLYLVHLPVLLTLVYLGRGVMPVGLLAIAAIPLSLAMATIFHALVERPSRVWARRVGTGRPRPLATSGMPSLPDRALA